MGTEPVTVMERCCKTAYRLNLEGRREEYERDLEKLIAKGVEKTAAHRQLLEERYQPLDGRVAVFVPEKRGPRGPHRRVLVDGVAAGSLSDEAFRLEALSQSEFIERLRRRTRRVEKNRRVGDDEIFDWVSSHLAAERMSLWNCKAPNRKAWALLLWALENTDRFWAMAGRNAELRKKAEKPVEAVSARRMELDEALRVVGDAAKVAVVDAAELDQDNMGLADLAVADKVIAVAEFGEDGEE